MKIVYIPPKDKKQKSVKLYSGNFLGLFALLGVTKLQGAFMLIFLLALAVAGGMQESENEKVGDILEHYEITDDTVRSYLDSK